MIEPGDDRRNIDLPTASWWLACFGDTLVWARLTLHSSFEAPAGSAEVLDCDGRTLAYDDETAARMALLDADFREFDGLDEHDAAALGFDLASTTPPHAAADEDLPPRMVQKLALRQ